MFLLPFLSGLFNWQHVRSRSTSLNANRIFTVSIWFLLDWVKWWCSSNMCFLLWREREREGNFLISDTEYEEYEEKNQKIKKHHHLVFSSFFYRHVCKCVWHHNNQQQQRNKKIRKKCFQRSISIIYKKSTGYSSLTHTKRLFHRRVCDRVQYHGCRKSSKRFVFCVVCVVGYPSKRRKFKKENEIHIVGNTRIHRNRKFKDFTRRWKRDWGNGYVLVPLFSPLKLIEEIINTHVLTLLYQICSKSLKNHQHAHVLTSLFLYKVQTHKIIINAHTFSHRSFLHTFKLIRESSPHRFTSSITTVYMACDASGTWVSEKRCTLEKYRVSRRGSGDGYSSRRRARVSVFQFLRHVLYGRLETYFEWYAWDRE